MIVGLILNAAGNGLCIVGAMGSGLWTAAAINLNDWQGWNIGAVLFTFGVLNAISNLILIRQWDWLFIRCSSVTLSMFSRGYLLGWVWEIGLSSPESLFPALAFSAFVLRFRCINARISSCIPMTTPPIFCASCTLRVMPRRHS